MSEMFTTLGKHVLLQHRPWRLNLPCSQISESSSTAGISTAAVLPAFQLTEAFLWLCWDRNELCKEQ